MIRNVRMQANLSTLIQKRLRNIFRRNSSIDESQFNIIMSIKLHGCLNLPKLAVTLRDLNKKPPSKWPFLRS